MTILPVKPRASTLIGWVALTCQMVKFILWACKGSSKDSPKEILASFMIILEAGIARWAAMGRAARAIMQTWTCLRIKTILIAPPPAQVQPPVYSLAKINQVDQDAHHSRPVLHHRISRKVTLTELQMHSLITLPTSRMWGRQA